MATARPIKGLGEVAFRVEDLARMAAFYETVVGLELMGRDTWTLPGGGTAQGVFFRIADGFGGHTQALVLFDRSGSPGYRGLNRELTTVDHVAFEIALSDFASEKARLEGLGIQLETAQHAWVHWRSLYFHDPEGNQIELVCYDKTVGSDSF